MAEVVTSPLEQTEETQVSFQAEPPFGHVPDHTELPYEDGTFVKNFQEHPQSVLLTETIWPILEGLHLDGQFAIGQDSGIYWRLTEPPENGAIAPDWFYVPNVPPLLDGEVRRSYVLWQEAIAPLIVIEFVSATDGGERDRTPKVGKFWIYEQAIRAPYYAIYDVKRGLVDVYHLVDGRYQPLAPNARKHFSIPALGLELGIWRGNYKNQSLPWLRWWDAEGNLIPTPEARAEHEAQRAEQEAQRAEREAQRAEREAQRANLMAEKLRALGIDPDEIA